MPASDAFMPPPDSPVPASDIFIQSTRRYLSAEYLPKIERCLEQLSDEDLWWQPNPHSNSIGTLLRHMQGNIRQYIVSGVGGEPDRRRRTEEFTSEERPSKDQLLNDLKRTLDEVDNVLAGLQPEALTERRTIQGREKSLLDAVYHATEHFSMHTGQIIYITKMRTGRDLGFYSFPEGTVRTHWSRS